MLKSIVRILLGLVLGLPVAHLLIEWVTRLLRAMDDEAGAAALRRVNLTIDVVWLLCFFALVVAVGLTAAEVRRDFDDESDETPL